MSQPEGLDEIKPPKRGRKPKKVVEPQVFNAADGSLELDSTTEATMPLMELANATENESTTVKMVIPPARPTPASDSAVNSPMPTPEPELEPEPEPEFAGYIPPAQLYSPNSPNSQALALVPEEVPIFLRNPGPPPKMPRNAELLGAGRNSYRFREIRFGVGNYKWLLLGCAVVGVILLGVLLIGKPQKNVVVSLPSLPVAKPTATAVPTATPNSPIVMLSITPAEQYALVVAQEGVVLEEPKDNAAQMQVYARYTVLSLTRKTNRGWYEIKGSIGWIKADSLKFYPDIDSAWAAKREIEGSTTNG